MKQALKIKKDEGNTKAQSLFYGVFALLTLGIALYISTFEIPNSMTFSHESLFFAKILFFLIFMIMNAYFVVKTIQIRSKYKNGYLD